MGDSKSGSSIFRIGDAKISLILVYNRIKEFADDPPAWLAYYVSNKKDIQ